MAWPQHEADAAVAAGWAVIRNNRVVIVGEPWRRRIWGTPIEKKLLPGADYSTFEYRHDDEGGDIISVDYIGFTP